MIKKWLKAILSTKEKNSSTQLKEKTTSKGFDIDLALSKRYFSVTKHDLPEDLQGDQYFIQRKYFSAGDRVFKGDAICEIGFKGDVLHIPSPINGILQYIAEEGEVVDSGLDFFWIEDTSVPIPSDYVPVYIQESHPPMLYKWFALSGPNVTPPDVFPHEYKPLFDQMHKAKTYLEWKSFGIDLRNGTKYKVENQFSKESFFLAFDPISEELAKT